MFVILSLGKVCPGGDGEKKEGLEGEWGKVMWWRQVEEDVLDFLV